MRRAIMDYLLEWKERDDRKPLLLTGVRQCGKTYILEEFGKSSFDSYVHLNFDKQEGLASLFDYDFDVHRIVRELESMVVGAPIVPGKTLLVFDEIQACPRAIESLKYFCEDMRELHLIAAGSLLGVALADENISFPVGKVQRQEMYPMSFEEFVWAMDGSNQWDSLAEMPMDRPVPELLDIPMKKLYTDYLIVGGMPEVVESFRTKRNYEAAEEIQNTILKDYASDFSKHAPAKEVPKIRWIWDSIPQQLAKENNKFVFSHVKSGKRAADLEDALLWLENAGLVYRLPLVENPEPPLSVFADSTYFKLYLADVGLLRTRAGLSYKAILAGETGYPTFKGAMAENYVMTELKTLGFTPYFWRSGNSAEVDFLVEQDGKVVPVEVKSADNTRAKSFRAFCAKYEPAAGVKLSKKNRAVNVEGRTTVYSIPLYEVKRVTSCG